MATDYIQQFFMHNFDIAYIVLVIRSECLLYHSFVYGGRHCQIDLFTDYNYTLHCL